MNRGEPRISVLLSCYNQARYIAEAVDSILMQRIATPIEVVLADDASTDGTREIAMARLNARRGIELRILPSGRNVGAVGNFRRGVASCRAPMVAVLEGDDYWTRPDKLEAQAAFLEANPGCPVCATNFHFLDARGESWPRVEVSGAVTLHTPRQLVADNMPGNLSSCMYRRAALVALPPTFWDVKAGDWLLNICAARGGSLGLLHESMSVYRKNDGIWNSLPRIRQLRLLLDIIPDYDAVTGFEYREDFARIAGGFRRELDGLRAGVAPPG